MATSPPLELNEKMLNILNYVDQGINSTILIEQNSVHILEELETMEKRKSTDSNNGSGEAPERKRSRPTSDEDSFEVDEQNLSNKENEAKQPNPPAAEPGLIQEQPTEVIEERPVEPNVVVEPQTSPQAVKSLPATDQTPSSSKKGSTDTIPLKKSAANINLLQPSGSSPLGSEELIRQAPSLEQLTPDVVRRHQLLVAAGQTSQEGPSSRPEPVPSTSNEDVIDVDDPVEPPPEEVQQQPPQPVAVVQPLPPQPAAAEPVTVVPKKESKSLRDYQEEVTDNNNKNKMGELSEAQLQMLVSDLQLQLNAAQQDKASLELEIRQKEEIVLKTQVQTQKNEATLKQEIKQLKEKLKEKTKNSEEDNLKDLEKCLKDAKEREAKAISELNSRHAEDDKYSKILTVNEENYQKVLNEFEKFKDEHMLTAGHLASLESAFSDLLRKYERSKASVNQLKSREDSVNFNLEMAAENIKKSEAKYESLKTYAQAQVEKCNKEILSTRDRYESDNSKLKAIVKRLEIKCNSLDTSLQQKNKECLALSELCDHITSNQVQSSQY